MGSWGVRGIGEFDSCVNRAARSQVEEHRAGVRRNRMHYMAYIKSWRGR